MTKLAHGWTDGGNRTNVAAAAYVIADPEAQVVLEERVYPFEGSWTNNDMELYVIYKCVEAGVRLKIRDFVIHSDSAWCVNILRGDFVLKAIKFKSMIDKIYEIASEFRSVDIRHVPRTQNRRADWFCRDATGQSAPVHPPPVDWV